MRLFKNSRRCLKSVFLFLAVLFSGRLPVNAQEAGQVISRLEIFDITTRERQIVYEDKVRFEAPNWSNDGTYLLFNQSGAIYKFIPDDPGRKPEVLNTGFADACNNDHGISPNGKTLAISHRDAASGNSIIYILPAEGGTPKRITELGPSYWHGWSPDGKYLAYCAERNGNYDVYVIPVAGGSEKRLTDAQGLDDGPEYSPDGKYIYFNSVRTGTMQLWRMDADGSNQAQLTFDDYNDWFPHPSPDGKWIVFISYIEEVDPGSHPPYKKVMLRLLAAEGGEPVKLTELFGGQGTINVPSWSPDSKKFAFVSYELRNP